jgi:Fe2+ transport system protein FeoA
LIETQTVPLTQLRRGEHAEVHRRDMCCEDCELLNAMGLTDRCRLRVCRAGRTCIVQVASTRLGLSAAMAKSIHVVRRAASAVPRTQ